VANDLRGEQRSANRREKSDRRQKDIPFDHKNRRGFDRRDVDRREA
jgi:hypothetical protein